MKKRIVLLMAAAVLTMGMMACGKNDTADNSTGTENNTEINREDNSVTSTESGTNNSAADVSSAVAVLENVWMAYGEDEKPSVMGGDAENVVDGAPGAYNIEDLDGINSYFHITADAVAMTDDAASAIHAMNANTFTSSVFHVTDAANVEAFAASVKESVLTTHWMCGFPEKLVIISVNENYVISAFGNGDMMELFKSKVTDVYGDAAVVLAEELIE